MYFVFQRDDSWHVIKFSTSGDVIENVIKIAIVFEKFPSDEISVKDLMVHICMSIGMYVKFIKYVYNIINGNNNDIRKR